jgi:hypothetical protein
VIAIFDPKTFYSSNREQLDQSSENGCSNAIAFTAMFAVPVIKLVSVCDAMLINSHCNRESGMKETSDGASGHPYTSTSGNFRWGGKMLDFFMIELVTAGGMAKQEGFDGICRRVDRRRSELWRSQESRIRRV